MEIMLKNNKNKMPVVVKAGAGYLIGNIILRGIVFLTTPIFTRIMSPDAYGQYSIYMSYESFIAIFVLAGMSGSVRRAKIDYKEQLDKYIVNVIFEVTLNFFILTIVLNVIELMGFSVLGYSAFMIDVLLLHSWLDSLIHIYSVKLSTYYKYKAYMGISFLTSLLNIIVSFYLIIWFFPNDTYYGRIYGTVFSMIIGGVLALVLMVKGKRIEFDKGMWIYAFKYSLPLMVHTLSMTVLSVSDRIMISSMIGYSEAGIYSLIYSFGMAVSLIWGSLDVSWSQWVFDKLENENRIQVSKYGEKYIVSMFLLVFMGMLIVPEILKVMVDSAYYTGIPLFMPLCAGAFVSYLYTFYVQLENFYKKTKYVAIGTLLSGIINIILNYFCIRWFGYEAAAYTTEISYVVLLLFHSFTVRRIIKKRIYRDSFIYFIGASMIGLSIFIDRKSVV